MKPPNFNYVRAESVDHALQALAAGVADGDTKVLAGGQSLVPLMNFRLARPQVLVDINSVGGQSYRRVAGRLEVGPLCRHRDVERDPELAMCDAMREAVPLIGHVAIRNRGTVVGSLVHGDPLAEWSTLAVLLGGRITTRSATASRQVDVGDWFRGFFETDIRPDELATAASFELPETRPGTGTAFAEIARRHGDFCLASAAAMVRLRPSGALDEVRLVIGGIDSTPWSVGEQDAVACVGEAPNDEMWDCLAGSLPASAAGLGSDIHATGSTRRRMAKVLARRVLASASARAEVARRRETGDGV